MNEHQHQVALMQWANLSSGKHPELHLLFAIPNGGERNSRVGQNLKLEGVKAGIPDLCLPVPNKTHHGLFIELKTPVGTLKANQKEWLTKLNNQGYKAVVCYGWESAKLVIEEYISNFGELK